MPQKTKFNFTLAGALSAYNSSIFSHFVVGQKDFFGQRPDIVGIQLARGTPISRSFVTQKSQNFDSIIEYLNAYLQQIFKGPNTNGKQ